MPLKSTVPDSLEHDNELKEARNFLIRSTITSVPGMSFLGHYSKVINITLPEINQKHDFVLNSMEVIATGPGGRSV